MGVYNGPSAEEFAWLRRTVDDEFNQIIQLRGDIQELINIARTISLCLQKLIKTRPGAEEKSE